MNKLSFLLITAVLFIFSCGLKQESNKKQVATVNPVKRTQQVDSLEITAVDIMEYQPWQCRYASITGGWGVRVRVTNIADHEVSETIGSEDMKITDVAGKKYSLPENFLACWTAINLEQFQSQNLEGNLFLFSTGTSIKIRDGNVAVGELGSIYVEKLGKSQLFFTLLPKKSIILVFVFDSPKESKPQTLFWPSAKGAKPIDLR